MNKPLHPRSLHLGRYDLDALVKAHPELAPFLRAHPVQGQTVDFASPEAVKALNAALLKHYYQLSWWDIPKGALCPPIPGRADYVHYLADLLEGAKGPGVRVLDVGTGASCIYPLLGQRLYGWSFVGSDVAAPSLSAAETILQRNSLTQYIELRLQPNRERIFQGVIRPTDRLTATMCNPPFHASAQEAVQQSQRKRKNLGQDLRAPLNFGGLDNELWCPGGELAFIVRMVEESSSFASQCSWFTTLVSNEDNLPQLRQKLTQAKARDVKVISMNQGQKKSRLLAWKF